MTQSRVLLIEKFLVGVIIDGVLQLGNANIDLNIKPQLNKYIINICCGAYHSLVLTNCGQVYAWG